MKEEKFTEDEYELTTDELDYYSLLNEYNMQPEMGELNNQKYKIHRIIFEDILIDPSYPLEDGVDRSLSIPFYDGIRSVWAPNGYGKTFAFKMLGLLNKSGQRAKQSDVIRNHKNMEDFLNNFFQSCYNELHSPDNNLSNILPEDLVSLSSNIQKKNLIPFSKISIRLVEEKRTEVVDISITPSWSNYSDFNDGYSRLKIKRKFWNVASIQTPFFERYPDSELLSIFNPNQSKSHDSVIESNFFHSSEHLPEGHVLFIEDNDLEKEDKYVDLFDSPFTNFPPRGKERFAREIQFFMRNLIQEKKYYNIEYDIVFDDTEKSLFSEITNFIEYTKTLTADSETKFQSYIEEGEKLLLEIFELSKKYRGLSLFGNPYGTGFGNHTGDVTGISYQSYDDDNLFSYLFVLMDSYLHEHNPPKSSWGGPPDEQKYYDSEYSSEAFGELIEKVSDYQFHKFGTSVMESLPWRIFDDTPAYFDYIPTDNYIEGAVHEIEKKGMPMCWDDGWFIDAINNLRVTYFEIPNIINYSSDSKLKSSQSDLSEMLLMIRNSYDKQLRLLKSEEYSSPFESNFLTDDEYIQTLRYIKEKLGNRHDTLSSLLGPLTNFHSWDASLAGVDLLESERGDIQSHGGPHPFLESDLHLPEFSETLELILRFVEIFDNINHSLNSEFAESWAASCRFNDWNIPMKFMDPKIAYDIESRHLSFGQCSVVALEVCIGRALFVDRFLTSGRDPILHPDSLQSCIVLDEPEIGRSEHWVNQISERIIEILDELDVPKHGNIYLQSFTVVSHRESLLRSLSRSQNYHIMQPLNQRREYVSDIGEEE